MDKFIFLPVDKHNSFLQVDCMTLGVHSQSRYLKGSMKDKVNFLSADKHQKFLQISTIILGVCGQTCPNYPK